MKAEVFLPDTKTRLTGVSPYFTNSSQGIIQGELVYIGQGEERDYDGIDVRGKIVVLTEMQLGFSIFWLGPYSEMASKHGAVGMIVIHPFPWPYRMSMEAGNVNTENRFVKQQVPAICLSAIDGLTLMHHIGQGKIKAEFEVNTATYDVDSTILSGIVVGDEKPEESIVIMGHKDHAIPPGANDNGSGLGCLLELERVLGHYKFRRSVEFICSTAEEGCSPGMAQYVQIHKDRTNKVKAAINLDMFGTGGRLQLVESGKWHDTDTFEFSQWLIEALVTAADDMGITSVVIKQVLHQMKPDFS
jgi:Iap family predicted aminopeptidase